MKQSTCYPKLIKDSILAKALAPNSPSVVELAKEFNLSPSTIYNWVHMSRKNAKQSNSPHRPHDKSAQKRLQAIIDTLGKSEEERNAYCRQHGFYAHHLDAWEAQVLESLGDAQTKQHKAESLQMKNEVKELKQDLNRKDKALAEVTALLILKKKADLLWGVSEDE